MRDFTSGHLTVDDGKTVVPGEWLTNERWNGWLCPRLRRDAVEQVLAALAEDPYADLLVALDDERFLLWDYAYEKEQDYEPEVVAPDPEGWYWLGAWAWCWSEVVGVG